MNLFPTTCVDNFFKDPEKIREYALSLDYSNDKEYNWPGKRTEPLHEVNKEYFDSFCTKLMEVFYDFNTSGRVDWEIETYFQLIDPYKNEDNTVPTEINQGWVHTDAESCVLAGVIYLNPNANIDSGTSLFSLKPDAEPDWNLQKIKETFYKTKIANQKVLNGLLKNRNCFIETARFNNVFNRMVCYDGSIFHSANSFLTGDEPRLTQVFFVNSLKAPRCPLTNLYKGC